MENNSIDTKQNKEREIVLITALPEEYQLQNNNFSVPTNFNKEKLNEMLKKLLNLDIKSKNFSFFIENQILDKAISQFLIENPVIAKNFPSEKSLEIFYSFELQEPELINTIKEDEWIRKIRVVNQFNNSASLYLVGLFNSEITIYNKNFEKIFKENEKNYETNDKADIYNKMLNDVLFFEQDNSYKIIKATRDDYEKIKIAKFKKNNYSEIFSVKKQKNEQINSLSSNPVNFNFFCAGSDNGTLEIYELPEKEIESNTNSNSNKKRKIEIANLEIKDEILNCASNLRLVKWINNQQVLTTGDDFYMKLYNVITKTNFLQFNTNYKLTTDFINVDNLILSGHEDGRIRLWDIRTNKQQNVYLGHSSYISALELNPISSNNFISTGYDSLVKIWDIRANKESLFSVKTDSERNYSVTYNSSKYILSGGDSSSVNIYNAERD
jgi:WD40 repeat protein